MALQSGAVGKERVVHQSEHRRTAQRKEHVRGLAVLSASFAPGRSH